LKLTCTVEMNVYDAYSNNGRHIKWVDVNRLN